MENVGANCTDIEIYRENEGLKETLRTANMFQTGAIAKFDIAYQISDDSYKHLVCAEYLDLMAIRKQRYFVIEFSSNRVTVKEPQGYEEPPTVELR